MAEERDIRNNAEGDGQDAANVAQAWPVVAETVVDIPETVLDDALRPVIMSGDIPFDATVASATEGRMAKCASNEVFVIHADDVIGSGSQGIVVRAADSSGRRYAAKVSCLASSARDRRSRKAVLDHLVSLMDDHPLAQNHFKQTHLMPVYAYGQVSSSAAGASQPYEVVIMALCDGSLDAWGGCSYAELRDRVIPQTAEGIRALHSQGIVHRDIKPKNLYLLEGSIVLGDYGISSLLDEGRDTGATVFDKRTPGYSPHTSVIQRENDWYALGYTIWTLYNGGEHPHQALIDAGDLSAVLAGKRPVEFVPRAPEEASLGDLVYGLTVETARVRLGFDDVQDWLENPASFRFESPLDGGAVPKSYQFKGVSYSDFSDLADAMAESWDDAKEHIYSGTLESFLTSAGQHDLAVSMHRIVDGDARPTSDKDLGVAMALTELKGSPDVFAWQGGWRSRRGVADAEFARLTQEPYKFYECCSSLNQIQELLELLMVAFFGTLARPSFAAAVRAAYGEITGRSGGDALLRVDNLLALFEAICADQTAVRRFFAEYGPFGNAMWAKRNLGSYRALDDEGREAVRGVEDAPSPEPEVESIEQMRPKLREIDAAVSRLSLLLPENPYDRVLGTEASGSVEVAGMAAYRVAVAYGESCTIGYAGLIVAPAEREHVCDYQALREAATSHAHAMAADIRNKAEARRKKAKVGDHSIFWHLVLMACTVLACIFVWASFDDVRSEFQAGYETYEPILEAEGGFVPDVWLDGLTASDSDSAAASAVPAEVASADMPPGAVAGENLPAAVDSAAPGGLGSAAEALASAHSCNLGLDLFLFGFMLAAACVLLVRLLQLLPVLFASLMLKSALVVASKVDARASRLADMPLSESIGMLLAGKRLGTEGEISAARKLARRSRSPFAKTEKCLGAVYAVALALEAFGIVLATITWAPVEFFNLAITAARAGEANVMLTGQAALLLGLGIYYAIVLKVGKVKPNMLVVLFVGAVVPFVCEVLV